MRTILDIDEDVLPAIKERAVRKRSPAGVVISQLARRTLTAAYLLALAARHRGRFVTSDRAAASLASVRGVRAEHIAVL